MAGVPVSSVGLLLAQATPLSCPPSCGLTWWARASLKRRVKECLNPLCLFQFNIAKLSWSSATFFTYIVILSQQFKHFNYDLFHSLNITHTTPPPLTCHSPAPSWNGSFPEPLHPVGSPIHRASPCCLSILPHSPQWHSHTRLPSLY